MELMMMVIMMLWRGMDDGYDVDVAGDDHDHVDDGDEGDDDDHDDDNNACAALSCAVIKLKKTPATTCSMALQRKPTLYEDAGGPMITMITVM
eukprot:12066090-Karenia_brevis.AAC.1